MKNLIFTFFLFLPFITASNSYAGNNTLTVNYPAPIGSYGSVILTNSSGSPACTASNVGLLFWDATTNALSICTSNGTPAAVSYPETCFNRFCSNGSALCTASANLTSPVAGVSCPAGYILATAANTGGSFTADGGAHTIYYAVCCGGTVPTVLPN